MGVGEDFSRFKDAYNISTDVIASISYRYRRITRQLNVDFWNTTSGTAHSLYVGSYGRDTAARGVSDLDVAFLLPIAVYERHRSYRGNGQSALLQAVKRSIQNTYRTSDTFGDGQVVVVRFADGITFEILPVFQNADGQSWTFPNANGGGTWRTCNPRAEMAAVAVRNSETRGNLKHLCRMMRIWRDYNRVPMSGMLIDTLAYQFIGSWSHRGKSFLYHDYLARDFFHHMSQVPVTQTHWRAPGSGAYVFKSGAFRAKAKASYLTSLRAIEYDDGNHAWSRRCTWRELFGGLYPNS